MGIRKTGDFKVHQADTLTVYLHACSQIVMVFVQQLVDVMEGLAAFFDRLSVFQVHSLLNAQLACNCGIRMSVTLHLH